MTSKEGEFLGILYDRYLYYRRNDYVFIQDVYLHTSFLTIAYIAEVVEFPLETIINKTIDKSYTNGLTVPLQQKETNIRLFGLKKKDISTDVKMLTF